MTRRDHLLSALLAVLIGAGLALCLVEWSVEDAAPAVIGGAA